MAKHSNRGPSGFWCRFCRAYQSTRTRGEVRKALQHHRLCADRAERQS